MKSFTEKIELFMNWNQSQSKIECLFERQEKKYFFTMYLSKQSRVSTVY